MIVKLKDSTMVYPATQDTPKGESIPISTLGQAARRTHGPRVYFYRANGSHNFFEAAVLKDALSKVLVTFYPLAGRLKKDHETGRITIDCKNKGVLFVEAETESFLDDLGDFVPSSDFRQLVPTVDYTRDISSFPLVILQVTRFKCGGVSLGVGIQHSVADGSSGFRFINAWSDMARGINPATQHFIDQTILRGRNPPTPAFHHIEYQPPPTLKCANAQSVPTTSAAIFRFTRDQLRTLKTKAQERIPDNSATYYTTFEVLGAHTWRSVCRARGLPDDQETKMYISTNGRSRLNPPIPADYFGNAVFSATPVALSGNIVSEPLDCSVGRIHDTLVRMDEEYLRSALDFLEWNLDQVALLNGTHFCRCPNIRIISWARMPIWDADFGWARPIYVGPTEMALDGMAYMLPNSMNDGSLSLLIALEHDHMELFKKFIGEI